MLEEAAVGSVTRALYGGFLGVYNGTKHVVRAVDSDRVLQSAATAMFFGAFPPGGGPTGGLPGRPATVPVHTVPEDSDDLLTASACYDRSDAEYAQWWASDGQAILDEGASVVEPIAQFCGVTPTSNKALKMQVDGIGFDRREGFVTNLSDAQIFAAQNLSIVLQRGLFATNAARTYLAGTLPQELVRNMEAAVASVAANRTVRPLYHAYFAHRHALYGLAEFFGWAWEQYGIPPGQVQTATTLFLELRHADTPGEYEVELFGWAPHCGNGGNLSACPRTPIALPGCSASTLCTLGEFAAIVSDRYAATGTYEQLCASAPPPPPPSLLVLIQEQTGLYLPVWTVPVMCAGSLAVGLLAALAACALLRRPKPSASDSPGVAMIKGPGGGSSARATTEAI